VFERGKFHRGNRPGGRENKVGGKKTTDRNEFAKEISDFFRSLFSRTASSKHVPQVRARFLGANLGAVNW
jgi:hypothetical protein